MEMSGLDRLLSYANDLGGVRAARDRADAPRPGAARASSPTPSRSLETDGVKLTLSSLASSAGPAAAGGATLPAGTALGASGEATSRDDRVAASVATRERAVSPRNRAAFSAYERAGVPDLGERIRIKA